MGWQKPGTCTLLGVSSFARFWRWWFGEFPRLVYRYCSYLLPKQTGGTTQILIFETFRMIGRPALYKTLSACILDSWCHVQILFWHLQGDPSDQQLNLLPLLYLLWGCLPNSAWAPANLAELACRQSGGSPKSRSTNMVAFPMGHPVSSQ